jgi:metal-sulfur cluster biosynthetic enzyme
MSPDNKSGRSMNDIVKEESAKLAQKITDTLSAFEKNPVLLEWLHPVEDPEMFISIVDLGLVYDVRFADESAKKANVVMSCLSGRRCICE